MKWVISSDFFSVHIFHLFVFEKSKIVVRKLAISQKNTLHVNLYITTQNFSQILTSYVPVPHVERNFLVIVIDFFIKERDSGARCLVILK